MVALTRLTSTRMSAVGCTVAGSMAEFKVTGTKVCCPRINMPLVMFAQPAVHDVSVDAVLQCQPGNGRTGLGAGSDNLQFELWAVEPSLGGLAGASVTRHGVHDVHRAHYLWISAILQYVIATRLRCKLLNLKDILVILDGSPE